MNSEEEILQLKKRVEELVAQNELLQTQLRVYQQKPSQTTSTTPKVIDSTIIP